MAANALASLALDRFVSASSADDAHSSLERILDALKNNKLKGEVPEDTPVLAPEMIWSDPDILVSLRHVLHTGKHQNQDMEVPVDEGASLVCKIYMEMVDQESTRSPLLEKDEALLECLIDVISSSKDDSNGEDDDGVVVSMYTRVLALQLLTKLCTKRPSQAQTQLLQAPNGLYRLGDLLQIHQEEIIRNEALLLAQVIAEWPSCAKIWMFSEVADQVILLAVEEGGMTKGNLLVQDCLDLLFKLWKHDPNLADLVFQSPTITDNLPGFLDLRKGSEFLNPPKKATAAKKDDDLDDILKSASDKEADSKEDGPFMPRLTSAEENVISKTLDILALLLESDVLKQSVWNREKNLCALLWELALVAPPPPQVPYACSVPTPQLQLKALETAALYFNDPNTMERHAGLDRLLYLVCTGGLGRTLEEKMGISQGALHVIRKTVSEESASQMLMYTLAPPMSMEDEGQPPPPTVVHKLLNTVAENVAPTQGIDSDRRKIFLAGALGGLSIFLTDQTSREVLLRLTTPQSADAPEDDTEDEDTDNTTTPTPTRPSLIESILHAVGSLVESQNPDDAFFSMTMLRFLCHWTVQTPAVVQTILSSNQSGIVLNALLSIKTKTQSYKKGVAVLGKLLLGLSMEYMGDDEEKCGGWSRAGIMELIAKKSGGVSKFTSSLEQFKSVRDFGDIMPWSVCELEFKVWSQWFADCVLLVRKRVVQELTGSGDGDDEDDDDEGMVGAGDTQPQGGGSSSVRSLQKVVYQQSQEIDALQQSLQKANKQIKSQDHEISEYKRRVESAPSQLDNMLDEYSAKISELETKVATGLEEKASIVQKHKTELQERDDQIAALQNALEESRALEREARDETQSLREEIESLSQAYTGLEQEYRQQQTQHSGAGTASDTTMTTSEQQPGEQEQEGSRPQEQQTSSTTGAGSTEISALRAENERLRGDAQAADRWMAMAVEKMRVLGQQNEGLQTELALLRGGQDQSELQQQYQVAHGENQSLIHQQNQLQAHLDAVGKENQELRQGMQDLHLQVGAANKELHSAKAALEEGHSQASMAKSDFDSRLAAMASDLENANAEVNRLMEQLNQQTQINTAGESQAAETQAAFAAKTEELEQLKRAFEGQTSETNALRAEVTQLREYANQQQRSGAQGESEAVAQATANFEATLASKAAEMNALSSAHDQTAAELEAQRAEAHQLREQLNEQQQKKVEPSASASDETFLAAQREVQGLRRELESKSTELDVQRQTHSNEVEALNSAMTQLQQETEASKAELGDVRRHEQEEIYQRESRIRELEARLNHGTNTQGGFSAQEFKQRDDEIAELKAANEAAQDWMSKAVSHHDMLSQQHSTLASENTTLTTQVRELREKISSNEAALAQARSLQQESQAQASRLDEAEASLLNYKAELERVQGELSLAQSQSNELAQVSAEVGHLRAQVGTLNASMQEQVAVSEQLRGELTSERASKAAVVEEVTGLKAKLDEANRNQDSSGEITSLQEQIQTLDSALKEQNAAYEQLSNEINAERESRTSALNEVESWKDKAGHLGSEIEILREQTKSLGEESQKSTELFNQLQRVKETNADLLRSQKDDKSAISRLNEEIAAYRAAPGALTPQAGTSVQLTSAQKFFASGTSGGGGTSVPETAHELFGAAPQSSTVSSAQELFGAAPSAAESAQDFFTAGKPPAASGGDQVSLQHTEKVRQVEQLEIQLNESRIELQKTKEMLAGNESVLRERLTELEATLEQKNAELSKARESSPPATAGASYEISSQQPQLELEETKTKLNEALTRLADDDNVVAQWEGRVAELESIVKDLESQIEEQEEAANSVIEQWQESCTSLEERNKELLQELSKAANGDDHSSNAIAALQTELEQTKAALATEQATGEGNNSNAIATLQVELEQTKAALVAAQANGQGNSSNNALVALQADLDQTKGALAAAQAKLEDDDSVVVKWEERVAGLESAVKDMELQLSEQEESASTVIAKWQESCNALEEKNAELLSSLESFGPGEIISKEGLLALQERVRELEAALVKAQEDLKDDDDVVLHWQERVAELESASKEMVSQMGHQEAEAKTVIGRWQESCTALEEQSQNLSQQLEASHEKEHQLGAQLQETQNALEDAKASLREDEESLAKWQERVSELEGIVRDLQQQLSEQESEAEVAIGQWQDTCNVLEEQNNQLSKELAASNENESTLQAKVQETERTLQEAKNKLKGDEESLAKGQKRVSELEEAVKDLEVQLGQQEEETKAVIAKWQRSCTALEERSKKLSEQLQASNENGEKLTSNLQEAQRGLEEAEKRIKDDEDVVAKWTDRVSELEAAANDLQASLDEQEREAETVIANWQESCSSLEVQKSELIQKLESTNEMEGSTKMQMEEAQKALEEAKESLRNDEDVVAKWQERVNELDAIIKDLEAQLAEQEAEANTAIEVWQHNCTSLEERNTELIESNEQNERLKQEAVSALQQQVTESESALTAARENVASADENAARLDEQISALHAAKTELEEKVTVQEEEARTAASQLQQSLTDLEGKNAELSAALNDANQKLELASRTGSESQGALMALQGELSETKHALLAATDNAADDGRQFQERIKELEATIGDLEEQLSSEEEEAKNVIEQWEQSYKAIEDQNTVLAESVEAAKISQHALQVELDETKQALAAAKVTLDASESEVNGVVADLQAKVKDIEAQLAASEEEASTIIAQWQETVASLETTKQELTEALDKSTEAQQSLQSQLASLETSKGEAEDALVNLQASNGDSESTVADLQRSLNAKQEELRLAQENVDSLEATLNEKEASLEDLGERAEEDEEVVKEWKKRTVVLEATIKEQKAELEEQEKEASDAILKWQERCTELEKERNELSQSLEAANDRSKELPDDNDSLGSSSQAQHSKSDDALIAEKARANDLKEQLAELESMVNLLQQRLLDSEKGSSAAREQIVELESLVNLLQQRLLDSEKEANAARTRLQEARSEYDTKMGELSVKLQEAQAKTESSPKDKAELEAKVLGLEEQIKEKDKDMANAVLEWQQHCVDLESKNDELSNQLESIRKDPEFEGSPEEHIVELEAQIKSLEEELEEAEGIVGNWQQSYQSLETRSRELESELAAKGQEIQYPEAADLKSKVEELKAKLEAAETALASAKELESQLVAKESELSQLSDQLEKATKERDVAFAKLDSTGEDDSTSMQDIPVDMDMSRSQQNETEGLPNREMLTKVKDIEDQVQQLTKERDTATVALESMKESSRALTKEFEESKTESAEIVNQWTERSKELESVVSDLEEQLELENKEATEAIGVWESRFAELQTELDESQLEVEQCQAEIVELLKAQLEGQDKLLVSYSDNYESESGIQLDAEITVEVLRSKIAEKQALVDNMLAKKDSDVNTLFAEMEQIRTTSKESQAALDDETTLALQTEVDDLKRQVAEKVSHIDRLTGALTNEVGVGGHVNNLESKISTLEAQIASLEQQVEEERMMKEASAAELEDYMHVKEKLSKFVFNESMVKTELEEAKAESIKLRESESVVKSELEEAKTELIKLREAESLLKSKLEEAKTETSKLRESLTGEVATEGELKEKLDALQLEKYALEQEVGRLSKETTELQDELQDANNAVQVYVAKEVSDRATAMAAHALREQLHEIRKQADADRAAYAAEKETRLAAEHEVERLRTDLFALVDISDQENELYGAAALTIKAADKIHRKERSEITQLRTSLTRALEELRKSRAAEKDAEERAAKASHHIVVCEQELTAAKSDMRYLIQTMDEMRQDEASRRASLEHRIRTLENDHDVLRRFHSSETDSLRGELTQAVLEKDRTLQLLKDSEKNNAAMIYAASKDHRASADESPEAELAKLRIEKAQLLVAAAEEGERTERRLREVIATEVSSAEADVLVERERRLAAEAACDNMKLLVVELQKDVQSYKDDINLGSYSPRKAKMEQENERLRQDIARLSEESASLRTKLDASESAQENANYRIEKLEAECRLAQASSNRLDREIKFHSEVQAEMTRMRTSPVVKTPVEDEAPKEKPEDDLRTVELYDKIHEQAEAMQRAREVHQALQVEHEDLLALLAQQEEIKRSLENALASSSGQMAVDAAIREAEESSIQQYGRCVRVSTP